MVVDVLLGDESVVVFGAAGRVDNAMGRLAAAARAAATEFTGFEVAGAAVTVDVVFGGALKVGQLSGAIRFSVIF